MRSVTARIALPSLGCRGQSHSATLAKKYGPLAQVNCKFIDKSQVHRTSVTFRQCGFPVELSSVEAPDAKESTARAVDTAMSLDVAFLDPRMRTATAGQQLAQVKLSFDQLREICTNAGRMLRFSISRPEGGSCYTCKSFVRDEWATVTHLEPLIETIHESANAALIATASAILTKYREELSSPAIVKEDFFELRNHLAIIGNKTAREHSQEDMVTRTFAVMIQVEDPFGNSFQVHSRNHKTLTAAYAAAARSAFAFGTFTAHRSLLSDLRWQLGALCGAVHNATFTLRHHTAMGLQVAEVLVNGTSIADESCQGLYRVELRCLANAIRVVMQEHPEALLHLAVPFPSEVELKRQLAEHDEFDILSKHRGPWNPFAVLTTITTALLGSNYLTEFIAEEDDGGGSCTRTRIVVNDGIETRRVLIERVAKEKTESWKRACQDAIRENFPKQHEKLLTVHEYAASVESIEGTSAKLRALPRSERVASFSTLFSMVSCFLQDDYGYADVQLAAVMGPGRVWHGEVHVEEKGVSHAIFQTDGVGNAKLAKKLAVFAVAKKSYPNELDSYLALGRSDFQAHEKAKLERLLSRQYDSRKPVTKQICAMIEHTAPALAPVTWRLEAIENRHRAQILSQGAMLVDEGGNEGDEPLAVLFRALKTAAKQNDVQLRGFLADYTHATPANIANERDLASHLFVSFIGALPTVSSVLSGGQWSHTLALELDGSVRIVLGRSRSENKKEGAQAIFLAGVLRAFPELLAMMANTPMGDAQDVAKRILALNSEGGAELANFEVGAHKPLNTTPVEMFLTECMEKLDKQCSLAVESLPAGSGQEKTVIVRFRRRDPQGLREEVGSGVAATAARSRHLAVVAALENLFDQQVAEKLEADAEFLSWKGA